MKADLDRESMAKILYSEGANHFARERYDLAISVFQRLFSEFRDITYAPEIAMWLGACHHYLGDQQLALEHLRFALDGIDQEEEDFYLIQILHYLAKVYYTKNNFSEALVCLNAAEPLYHLWQEPDSWHYRFDFRLLKGRVFMQLCMFSDGLRELMDSRSQIPKSSLTEEQDALFNYELGRAYHYLDKQEEAQLHLGKVDETILADSNLVIGYHHVMMRLGIATSDYSLTLTYWQKLKSGGFPSAYAADVYSLAAKAYYYTGMGCESTYCFRRSLESWPLRDDIKNTNLAYLAELAKAGYD